MTVDYYDGTRKEEPTFDEVIEEMTNDSRYRGGGSGTAYIGNSNQSTTGNVYGIYDLSGGVYESVAVFNDVDSSGYLSSNNWTQYTGLTVDSNSTKYATKYQNPSGSSSDTNAQYIYGIVGDATKEVYAGKSDYTVNWFGDGSKFLYALCPFLMRGSHWYGGSFAGVFRSESQIGNYYQNGSFRTVLCP